MPETAASIRASCGSGFSISARSQTTCFRLAESKSELIRPPGDRRLRSFQFLRDGSNVSISCGQSPKLIILFRGPSSAGTGHFFTLSPKFISRQIAQANQPYRKQQARSPSSTPMIQAEPWVAGPFLVVHFPSTSVPASQARDGLHRRPHRLKSCLCKPDHSVMILALDLDPTLANKPAQYHLACRNWEAVGKLPVGQAQMLHDGSVGHVWAFGRTSDGHLPFAFSPALQAGGLPKNRLLVQWIL
jgi:hypothetical protein